jgi:hypothetical protein
MLTLQDDKNYSINADMLFTLGTKTIINKDSKFV